MKKLSYFLFGALFIIAGCDLFEDLGTVNLSTTFSHSENFSISQDDPSEISQDFTVNATTDNEINRYREKIKSYTVKRVAIQILNYVGEEGITISGTIELGNASVTISNLDLSELFQSGAEYELDLDENDLLVVAAALEAGNEVTGSISGTVSGKPVDFTIKFIFEVEFEAEVLE